MGRWWLVAGIVGVAVLAAGGFYGTRLATQAGVGAAAMAKVVCSCVFVDQRTLEACRAEDPPGFEGIPVVIDHAAHTATSTLFGVITRRATYSEAYGCTLEP